MRAFLRAPIALWSAGLLAVAAGSAVVARAYVEARDIADGACLAAVHADLSRRGAFRAEATTEWRRWSDAETRAALAAAPPPESCDSSADARWRRELQMRSRHAAPRETYAHLWLKGRPLVSAPWGWVGLE